MDPPPEPVTYICGGSYIFILHLYVFDIVYVLWIKSLLPPSLNKKSKRAYLYFNTDNKYFILLHKLLKFSFWDDLSWLTFYKFSPNFDDGHRILMMIILFGRCRLIVIFEGCQTSKDLNIVSHIQLQLFRNTEGKLQRGTYTW